MANKFLLQDIFTITGVGNVLVGKVTEGALRLGMAADLGGTVITISSIESKHKKVMEALAGQVAGMAVKGGDKNLLNSFKGREIAFGEGTETPRADTPAITKSKGMFGIFGR